MMNKIFNAFKDGIGISNKSQIDATAKTLYTKLTGEEYNKYPYNKEYLNEGMVLVNGAIGEYWKPRYLIDHVAKCAYEFLNCYETLCTVTEDDIDFESMKSVSEDGVSRAHALDAHFPTRVWGYTNGVAEVAWQVNPDGRYYMDEDGFGMTPDVEETIYGFIDRTGNVVSKFRFIDGNWELLNKMREEAESIVKTKGK